MLKRTTFLFTLIVIINLSEVIDAQGDVQIHPNPTMQQFETRIITHPSNPEILLASAVTQDTLGTLLEGTMGWYCSTNGGMTWIGQDTMPTHTNLNQWMADPTVAIDALGNFFVGGIYNDQFVFIDRSTDGGVTWSQTTAYSISSGNHTPYLVIDTDPTSSFFGQLNLVSAGVRFSKSTDAGQNWSTPVVIGGSIGSWFKTSPSIAISPDSNLYVTWAGYNSPSPSPVHLGFNCSTDGGSSWGTATSIKDYNGFYGFNVLKGFLSLFSGPSIAVDNSNGAQRGFIYIVYVEKNPTTPDIFLIRSTDKGISWSEPIKVNQDNSNKDQWMPSIAVDPTSGNLFIVYYDSRNFVANDSAQVYISASYNGGESFQDILVSDVPFLPSSIQAFWANDYMGSYIGITALQNIVWPCWNDNRTGFYQLYTERLIVTDVREIYIDLPESFILEQNYPNPFNPSTTIGFQLPEKSYVEITVYDVLGNEVATLVDEYKPAGRYEIEFNASGLSTGVYFYRLQAGGFIQTKKMVLMK